MKKREGTPSRRSSVGSINDQQSQLYLQKSNKSDSNHNNEKGHSTALEDQLRCDNQKFREEKIICEQKLKKLEDKIKRQKDEIVELSKNLEDGIKERMELTCLHAEVEYLRNRVNELETVKIKQRDQIESLTDKSNELKVQERNNKSIILIQQNEIERLQLNVQEHQYIINSMKASSIEEKCKSDQLSKEYDKNKAILQSTIAYLRIQIKSTTNQRDENLCSLNSMQSIYDQYLRDKSTQDATMTELKNKCTDLTTVKIALEKAIKDQAATTTIQEGKLKKANLILQSHYNDCKMLLEEAKTSKSNLTSRLFESTLQTSKLETNLQKEVTERKKDMKRLSTASEYIISLRSQVSYLNTCLSEQLQRNEDREDCDTRLYNDIQSVDQKLRKQLLLSTTLTPSITTSIQSAHEDRISMNDKSTSVPGLITVMTPAVATISDQGNSNMMTSIDTTTTTATTSTAKDYSTAVEYDLSSSFKTLDSYSYPFNKNNNSDIKLNEVKRIHSKDIAVNTVMSTSITSALQHSIPTKGVILKLSRSTPSLASMPRVTYDLIHTTTNHSPSRHTTSLTATEGKNDNDNDYKLHDDDRTEDRLLSIDTLLSEAKLFTNSLTPSYRSNIHTNNQLPSKKKTHTSTKKNSFKSNSNGYIVNNRNTISNECFDVGTQSASLPSLYQQW